VSTAQALDRIKEGIAAAKAGDKATARRLFGEAVELDPNSEAGWLWLAGLAEAPLEALRHLERVLTLNPNHARAQTAIQAARVQAGAAAAKAKDHTLARTLLHAAVEQDPGHELAWLWLASVAESSREAVACLEKVLQINPGNERARVSLDRYRGQLAAVEATTAPAADPPAPPPTPRPSAPAPAEAEVPAEATAPAWTCPLCEAEAAEEGDRCAECGALLTLDDPEAFFGPGDVDTGELSRAVERLERANRKGDFHTSFHLGLAHLNLKQLDQALPLFQAALRLRPTERGLRARIEALARLQAPGPGSAPRESPGPRKTVLVVDDSPTIRKLVSITLERRGFQTRAAADGYEAIDVLRDRGVPDLILLDVAMPGMDGYQLCKLLRQNADTAAVPIVMLSGKDGFFSKVRGRIAGSTEYLTKPFQPERLLRVVERHCSPAGPAPEPAAARQ
jgi:twitching motility two-component system response regulator PilG